MNGSTLNSFKALKYWNLEWLEKKIVFRYVVNYIKNQLKPEGFFLGACSGDRLH